MPEPLDYEPPQPARDRHRITPGVAVALFLLLILQGVLLWYLNAYGS